MTGWFAASYVWRQELPDLGGELDRLRRTQPQTTEEAVFALESISARLGIPIQTKAPKGRT